MKFKTIFMSISLVLFLLASTSQAQLITLVSGKAYNPDGSEVLEKEIQFSSFLTSEKTDTSELDSCSAGGGWAINLTQFNETGTSWAPGDTLIVLFENVNNSSPFFGTTYSISHVTTADNFQQVGDITLPVELTTFESMVEHGSLNDKVVLKWKTLGETNNLRFDIEKSVDGETFSKIGEVPGHGSTTVPQSYIYRDPVDEIGLYYYRLKQIDTDGTYSYSEVNEIMVSAPDEFALLQNYPNPFNPETSISFKLPQDSKVMIQIFNVLGQEIKTLVNTKFKAGTHTVTFNGRDLPSGMYIFAMQAGNFKESKRMTLVK